VNKTACRVKADREAAEAAVEELWLESCDMDAKGSEQALVRLAAPGGEGGLQLCAHHFNKLESRLVTVLGWKIDRDIRHILADKK
jgi:hypothetical protein